MLEHLSYSSISTFLACGESWRFKYVDKLPTYSTPALVFGSAIHGAIEGHVQGKGGLLDLWPGSWEKALSGQTVAWGIDTPEQHYNEGIRILSNGDIQRGLAQLKPLAENGIERKVELRVPGVPVPVIGYIDIITEDGIPGDFKTSSKSWSDARAAGELQPLFYLAALNQAGVKVPSWKFRHYTIIKTKTPKFETFEVSHSPKELFYLFRVIQSIWTAISAGVYIVNPSGWKCNPDYCDFWAMCRGKYR